MGKSDLSNHVLLSTLWVCGSEFYANSENEGDMMKGSNSLEVVRNMKNMALFTAVFSFLLTIGIVLSNTTEVLGYPTAVIFVFLSLYLSRYSMKQRSLWVANEKRLLKEVQSSASSMRNENATE